MEKNGRKFVNDVAVHTWLYTNDSTSMHRDKHNLVEIEEYARSAHATSQNRGRENAVR